MKDPLDKVFDALSNGDSYAKQINLEVGSYKIETYFVRINMTVRPIDYFVLDDKHTNFRATYRKQVAQAQPLTAKDLAASPDCA